MAARKIIQDMAPRGAKSRPDIRPTSISADVRRLPPTRSTGSSSRAAAPSNPERKEAKQQTKQETKTETRETKSMRPPMRSTIPPRTIQKSRKARRARSIWTLAIIGIVCVAAFFFILSMAYAKAVVTVTPKSQTIPFSGNFTACANTPCVASSTNSTPANTTALAYEMIELPPEELDQNIPITSLSANQAALTGTSTTTATASSTNAGKATGTVIMYNAFSSTTPQKLPIGTHISNSKGLIYVTLVPVSIPPSKKTTKGVVPGSVAVPVMATMAGAAYNIAPTDLTGDFKVVAYTGSSKYTTIYGRLKPDVGITGGATTTEKMVAPTLLDETYAMLETELQTALLAKVKTLIPAGYVMYDGTYSIDYTKIPPSATSTLTGASADPGTLVVGVQATFYGAMIKQADLAAIIAARQKINLNSQFPNQSYTASGLDAAQFHLVLGSQGKTSAQPFSAKNGSTLTFSLSGSVKVTGTVPTDELAQKLAGLSIDQSKAIFAGYSGIASAHAIITPFWKHSFPDSSKITINIAN